MKHLALSTALAMSLAAMPAWANEKPGEGVTVRPIMNLIIEEAFPGRVLIRALEDLGYDVAPPQEVEIQTAHLALATGDGDFFPSHWTNLHKAYFDESGGDEALERIGPYIAGASQGYLIDKKTYDEGITDISQLKDPEIAAKFDADRDGKADLAGCVPGWGCERVIEHHMDEYGLRDTVNHNQGAYNAIIADTIARYENGQPILYFTWLPYWVAGVLVVGEDVEWLTVPHTSLPDGVEANTIVDGKNLGFAVDDINILATDQFLADNPPIAALFKAARMDVGDASAQNKLMVDGEDSSADIDRHVDDWIKAHQAEYDSWLEAARNAAAQ